MIITEDGNGNDSLVQQSYLYQKSKKLKDPYASTKIKSVQFSYGVNTPTSRTISAGLLRWSLTQSIAFGLVSQRAFKKELVKQKPRKSTVDNKSIQLIAPDSEEAKQIDLADSRRSKTESILESSDDSDEEDTGMSINNIGKKKQKDKSNAKITNKKTLLLGDASK